MKKLTIDTNTKKVLILQENIAYDDKDVADFLNISVDVFSIRKKLNDFLYR